MPDHRARRRKISTSLQIWVDYVQRRLRHRAAQNVLLRSDIHAVKFQMTLRCSAKVAADSDCEGLKSSLLDDIARATAHLHSSIESARARIHVPHLSIEQDDASVLPSESTPAQPAVGSARPGKDGKRRGRAPMVTINGDEAWHRRGAEREVTVTTLQPPNPQPPPSHHVLVATVVYRRSDDPTAPSPMELARAVADQVGDGYSRLALRGRIAAGCVLSHTLLRPTCASVPRWAFVALRKAVRQWAWRWRLVAAARLPGPGPHEEDQVDAASVGAPMSAAIRC